MLNPIFLRRKIKWIQEDLKFLENYRGMSFDEVAKDTLKWRALEWTLAKIIGRAIDINRHIIAELADKNIEPPSKHRETFLILSKLDVLPKIFVEKIADSASLRNRIIHEYDDLDQKKVYETVDEAIEQYAEYGNFILTFLDKQKQ